VAHAERHRSGWRARFKTPQGWQRAHAPRGHRWTKAQAKAEAARLERAALGGELPPAEAERLTLGDLCRWWLKTWCKEASHGRELSRLKTNVLEHAIGALPLRRVTADVLEARLREMEAAGSAPASVAHVRKTLRRVFNCASKSKIWNRNPAAETSPRSMDPVRETRPLTAEELPRVVAAIGEPWKRDLVVTALYTLMRKGELLALRRDALDFDAGTIRIARSHERTTTKGGHADTIPMATPLRPYLMHAVDAAGESELVFPAPGGGRRPASTDAVAIIRRALRDAGLVEGWDHVCRRCKGRGTPHVERHRERRTDLRCPRCSMRLWAKPVRRPFTFHGLRHTGASLLARSGQVPIHVLQRILRHRSIDTTIRRYVHLYDGDLRAALEKLPELPPPPVAKPSGAPEQRAAAAAAGHAPAVPPFVQVVKSEGPDARAETAVTSGPSRWRAVQDSNLWPSAPEADALSS
jgi:integrase